MFKFIEYRVGNSNVNSNPNLDIAYQGIEYVILLFINADSSGKKWKSNFAGLMAILIVEYRSV